MRQHNRTPFIALGIGAVLLLAGCERPPPVTVQQGYRGTGMVAVSNPRHLAELQAKNVPPPALPLAEGEAPLAKDVYQNVQVLTDLNVTEFVRQMTQQANWVAPKEQCNYCHNPANFASDEKYTKVVARRMLAMTRDININWQKHVAQTGVTCYTCHRGNPVPEYKWFADPGPRTAPGMAGNRAGQNAAAMTVALSSLPYDPFTPYLLGSEPIRVETTTALPSGNHTSIKKAEQTYGLMVHISSGLGVNCTHCHNTQQFASWDGAPPARVTAWYAIRTVRELNNKYMLPLQTVFPKNRLGPMGDVAKINCTTCHQGQPKPLNGVSVLATSPELARIKPPPPAAAETAPAAAPEQAAPVTGAT